MQNNFTDRLKIVDKEHVSEVVRDALRLHALSRQRTEEELGKEIELVWNSPVSSISVKDILDEMMKQEF